MIPTTDDVRRAAATIEPWIRHTPVITVDREGLVLKLELLQHGGSFKVRGAFTSVLSAPERPATLVAASGGNHGLAVAYVGRALGIPAQIFVPESAPRVKVAAIERLGADVHLVGATYAASLEASLAAAAEPGAMALHAYDAWGTVTGQGTVGLELAEQAPDLDTVLVAVGGGGLIAGLTLGLQDELPAVQVVGVEPEACPTLATAMERGRPEPVEVGGVAADALGASRLGEIAWQVTQERGVASVLVPDEEIVRARQWLWDHVRVAAEPAGAAALAAVLSGAYRPDAGERVCVVVCGGNADPSALA